MTTRTRALSERVAHARAGVLASQDRHPSVRLALSLGERDRQTAGGLLGAALAFRIFLWLLPAILVVAGGLGFVPADRADADARSLGLSEFATEQIRQASAQSHRARWLILILGGVLLYMASVSLAKAVIEASRVAWGLPRPRVRAARAAAVLIAAMTGPAAVALLCAWLRSRTGSLGLVTLLLTVLVWISLWWGVSLLLPRPPGVRSIELLPGAVLFGVGLYGLHLFTVLYLGQRVATQSKLYGALGGAATILLWAYLLGRLVVMSAAMNATLFARRSRGDEHRSSP
jgi:uncharacterized BrkB/YihY/UPF0761 family membrane protein